MTSRKARATAAASLALAALMAPLGLAKADEAPSLRKGLWKFHRVVGAQTIENERCTNPSDDWRKPNPGLKELGCSVSPVTKFGNSYSFTMTCTGAMAGSSTSVITVESDSAYKLTVTSKFNGQTSKELLTATRLGDCKEP